MAHETTTSNVSNAPMNSSTGQQTANQASQLSGASSTHSAQPRSGAGSALPSFRFPELTGGDSGDAADNEDSSDDGEQSDQEIKVEVAASEKGESTTGDMDEFERLEAQAASRASRMISEDGVDSSNRSI